MSYQYTDAQIKRAVIDETTAASNTVIAAVAGKILLVLEYSLTVSAVSIMTWTAITGPLPLGVNQTHYARFAENGHFQTVAGAGLILTSSEIVNQGGWIRYVEV